MFARALILALWGTYAAALAPLNIPADDGCALYLTGPGRSSAYDYSLNLLKGNFGYDGQHSCITYDAINQAYLDARNRILVAQPKGDWKPEDFASVGELMLDISIQLARTYGLTYEEIEKGLPLIDTSRTLIREVCPPVFSHVECRAGKYRRLDGLCNNLQHPTWGATMAPFQRLIGPLFADGINAPRISHSGRDLPLSRVVSRTMHPDDGFHDHAGTVMVIAWGQFMDHDYTLTGTPLDPVHRNDPEECCKRPLHLKHPYCNEIRIPDDDYFYRLFGVKCIDFVRGFPSPRPGCRLGSRIPFNTLTGAIDGNTVYGVTDKFARKLRTGYGGLLRMNPVFKEYGLKDLLPLKLDIPDEGCTRPNKNMYCFEAGEIRVNEQLVLTVMHTLMAREHNRVAEGLAAVNPHWDDETLFQEARRINIAEIQHITYNEFLPILLGKDVMEKFGLVLEKQGYWNGYDSEVNPDVLASFAAAAYRFGHSLLPTAVERWSKAHKFIASKRLSDLIRRPYDLYRAGVLDEYVMGLMNQVAQAMDDSITQEVTNHLFKKVGARFGMDLVSFNMQRGREFGLPGYMEFRKFCGLSGADTFDELFGSMPNETVRKYETIFEHPVDVDLWSGGVSERPLPGSMLGPTFACIIATQFSYSRRGDRFWFELPNQPSSFTPEQLSEIRKSRLARVICDNTDIIDTVQLYPMVLPDHELNPRVPCRSGIIPQMDFSKWADPVPFHGAAKQFITVAVAMSNENQNITLDKPPQNATIIKSITNTTNDINVKSNSTIKEQFIEILDKDNQNVTEKPAGNDTQTVLKEQYIAESDLKQNHNNDTLMKYIYKKNEKVNLPEKSKGHVQNSLKRKKRFINSSDSDIVPRPQNLPVSIDYVDIDHAKVKEEIFLPATRTGGIVQSSNLADFNIETIHSDKTKSANDDTHKENINPKAQIITKFSPSLDKTKEESQESDENHENKYRLEKRPENKDPGENRSQSDEISSSIESEHSVELPNTSTFSEYIGESKETEKYRDSINPIPPKKTQNEKNQETDKAYESSIENSSETNHEYTGAIESSELHSNQGNNSNSDNSPLKVPKQDYVNLEINKGNEDGYPLVSREKYTKDVSTDSLETPKLSEEVSNESKSDESTEIYTDLRSVEELKDTKSEKQTRINDDEVKPVVELNNGSIESSEEISDEDVNSHLKNNSKLVSLTPVKNIDTNKKDASTQSDNSEKVDVKQQFERIPLDYNHANEEIKNNSSNTTASQIKPTVISSEEKDKEGTLDTLTPLNPTYDDDLNIKFHDVPIKLPEIKLPEDILSYAYDGPYYETKTRKDKDAQKQKFYYNYEDDDVDKNPREKYKEGRKKYNKEDDFYDYYKNDKEYDNVKRNSKIKNEEDDNEDLYEKFVRERFGKKPMKQRSEKIQVERIPSHLKLRKTLKNILKKTENVKKEAEKSGDPNANYMWTLEYGENL